MASCIIYILSRVRLLCIPLAILTVGKQFVTSFLSRAHKYLLAAKKALEELPPQDGRGVCLLCDLLGCYYVKHNNQLSVCLSVSLI